MPEVLRQELPTYLVCPDTSILWDRDKNNVVTQEFNNFWDEHSNTYNLKLIIPETVRGELLYQQTRSTQKKLDRIKGNIEELNSILESKYRFVANNERVEEGIRRRLDRWIEKKGGRVQPIPYNSINLEQLHNQAIWRLNTFELKDPNDDKYEKGFRDSLILASVQSIEPEIDNYRIAFITEDGILKKAADELFSSREHFYTFSTLTELGSELRLVKQNLDEQFVKEIQVKAAKKFFNRSDSKSLIIVENIAEKIFDQFKDFFENPHFIGSDSSSLGIFDFGRTRESWTFTDKRTAFIGYTSFEDKQNPSTYIWITPITIVRIYRGTIHVGLLSTEKKEVEKLLELSINVRWKSSVDSLGRFYKCKFMELNLDTQNSKFIIPTDDDLKHYNLSSQDTK